MTATRWICPPRTPEEHGHIAASLNFLSGSKLYPNAALRYTHTRGGCGGEINSPKSRLTDHPASTTYRDDV